MFIQSTAVAFKQGAVLILGSAGIGKTTLALRLMEKGADLIADDGVALNTQKDKIWVSTPCSMRGCLELKGLGILSGWKVKKRAPLRCVIQLTDKPVKPQTDSKTFSLDDVSVPLFELSALDLGLDVQAMAAFWVAIGKISLFSELNMVEQNKLQFLKRG